MIKIYIRDCNGKRYVLEYQTPEALVESYNADRSDFDDDMYEIQIVVYDEICVYSGLMAPNGITFEELISFFA